MGATGTVILVIFTFIALFGEAMAPWSVPAGGYDDRFGQLVTPTDLAMTETVEIRAGEYTEVRGVFIDKPGWPGPDLDKFGILRVTTNPSVPSTIVMDSEWRSPYEINWMKIRPGDHLIEYTDVPGYVTPPSVGFEIEARSDVMEITANFTQCGKLNVSTSPEVPATISVDGFPRGEGSLLSDVTPGTYTISFGEVEGYLPPVNSTVTVGPGGRVDLIGQYTPSVGVPGPDADSYGMLKVSTSPAVPSTIYVEGNWTTQWGLEWLKLKPGTYNLTFSDVPGYRTPHREAVRIVAGETTNYTAVFGLTGTLRVITEPHISSTILVDGVARNEGDLLVQLDPGIYTVTFRSVENYGVPPPAAAELSSVILPFLASLLVSSMVTYHVWTHRSSSRSKLALALVFGGLALSAVCLSIGALDDVEATALEKSPWLYPASLVGIAASLCAMGLLRPKMDRDIVFGMVLACMVPLFLVPGVLIEMDNFGRASYMLFAFIGAGLAASMSAMKLNISFKKAALFFTLAGKAGENVDARHASTVKWVGVVAASVLAVSGVLVYVAQNWTTHWMGTDVFGIDIFSELLYGARTSIIVGIFSAVIASVLGALIGLYSGFVGGWKDEVIMRANDVVLSIPWLVLMIIVAAMLGKIDLTGIILIIGLTGWSATARMVRAQVLSIRERMYVERARCIGSSSMGIIRRHILPNSFPLVFANTILTVAVSILSEATLSFLGMRPIGVVTWGTMLDYAQSSDAFSIGLYGWIVAPGLCIVLVVLAFTLLGYALDDIMNPKLRKR
jgi:peptide/nickel transport system permease protein